MSGSSVTSKEGERILAASRRPDGTLRKPVRIRAGYTPQDEVALYQTKGAIFKQGMPAVPPGYDPEDAATKPKTKAARKNEKRKEKKQQSQHSGASALQSSIDSASSEDTRDGEGEKEKPTSGASSNDVGGVAEQMNSLSVSRSTSEAFQGDKTHSKEDITKRIRALSKKIRLAESLKASSAVETMTPEQKEKVLKLSDWRSELAELECRASSK